MREYTDEYWYGLLLTKDSASRPLTSIQKSIIIEQSMQEAKLQKICMENRFGRQDASTYLQQLGFTLEEEDTQLMPGFLYMGLLEPAQKHVRLNQRAITLISQFIKTQFPDRVEQYEKLREIVCFHELYHAVEEGTKGIYTRNVRVRKRFLHMIPYYETVEAASEIGAIHFSKLMCDAAFSPYIYTQYLLAAVNRNLEVEDGRRDN